MSTDSRFDGPGPDDVWRDALRQERFLIQRCRNCERHRFPPALVCAACGGSDLVWVEASGRGVVYASTVVREREGSYNVALIDLAEGARLMSRVDGLAPEAVRIGMSVTARIETAPEPILLFHATDGGVL
ncbi:Zn-ribbon domain-containing OB-fold protein [Microvirga pudoricolor]|uniref:Zn-ribbon domain-containing OB-fold protein n=1 Tax=Microvirga pudoricolor TaxID=2778729 RepID=UPI0019527D03|nr:OB-fold domain-containing protein [Microvirga pudoricolor]MBM6594425.1 OB-fold domain-containing protein [Microvirga pudoricolor]